MNDQITHSFDSRVIAPASSDLAEKIIERAREVEQLEVTRFALTRERWRPLPAWSLAVSMSALVPIVMLYTPWSIDSVDNPYQTLSVSELEFELAQLEFEEIWLLQDELREL